MIKPTKGRVVWYNPLEEVGSENRHAAIIVMVHNDELVNLACFDEAGVPYHRQMVKLIHDPEVAPEQGECEWMPYQHGQAAKYDTGLDEVLTRLATIEAFLAAEGIALNREDTPEADIPNNDGVELDPGAPKESGTVSGPLPTAQSVMNYAAVSALTNVRRLDSAGGLCTENFDVCVAVEYVFEDGMVIGLPEPESRKLDDFEFPVITLGDAVDSTEDTTDDVTDSDEVSGDAENSEFNPQTGQGAERTASA